MTREDPGNGYSIYKGLFLATLGRLSKQSINVMDRGCWHLGSFLILGPPECHITPQDDRGHGYSALFISWLWLLCLLGKISMGYRLKVPITRKLIPGF